MFLLLIIGGIQDYPYWFLDVIQYSLELANVLSPTYCFHCSLLVNLSYFDPFKAEANCCSSFGVLNSWLLLDSHPLHFPLCVNVA